MAYQVSSNVYPAYSSSTPIYYPPYSPSVPSVYSVSTPVYTPTLPPSSKTSMPSTTTAYVTSALTLTSYVTAQYSAKPVPPKCEKDIIGTVQKLPQCVQTNVFGALAISKCSPCDYACICNDLQLKAIGGYVSNGCSKADYDAYLAFEKSVCGGSKSYTPYVVVTPTPYPAGNKTQQYTTYTTTTICPVTTSGKVTSVTSTITVTSCKAYCTSAPPPPPPSTRPTAPPSSPVYPTNGTTTVQSTNRVTSTVRVTGSSAAPPPGSSPAPPPGSSPAPPPGSSPAPPASSPVVPPVNPTTPGLPVFTGAAAANMPVAAFAGAVGLMGWAFAAM